MQSNITIPHSYVVSVTSDFIEDAPHSAFDVPLRRYQNQIRRVTKKPKKDFDVQHLAHRYARQAPDATLLMTATIQATPLIRPGHPAYLVWAEWSEKQENLVSENSYVLEPARPGWYPSVDLRSEARQILENLRT